MSEPAVVDVLRGAPGHALMASELHARLAARDVARAQSESDLAALERGGRVVVAAHPPPDVHLVDLDLRTVALVPEAGANAVERARAAAEACWSAFLRAYLATHRCT